MLAWDLEIPPAAVGAVIAICDGYEGMLMLRSVAKAPATARGGREAGRWAAWVAPAFTAAAAALMRELAARFGVKVIAGLRPLTAADLAAGMPLRLDTS